MALWMQDLLGQFADLNVQQVITVIGSWFSRQTWQDAAEAVFVGMSVVGQHYISQRRSAGFWFWLFGNVVALFLFASLGRWPTVGLYAYFTWKCISGIRTWKTLDTVSNTHEAQTPSSPKVAHAG